MKKFRIKFGFVGGDSYVFAEYEAENYNIVASEITSSRSGWFGTEGKMINLSNVTSCQIHELDKSGGPINP